jgi:hypothetical protein|eukprot:COSAG01_NODE_6530_length_3618_cov_2.527991_2_plen_43_part_00
MTTMPGDDAFFGEASTGGCAVSVGQSSSDIYLQRDISKHCYV